MTYRGEVRAEVVMLGLVPGIHVFLSLPKQTRMAGTSPAMTIKSDIAW
jgi:hypothetical protein